MKKITFLILTLFACFANGYAQFPAPYCIPTPFEYIEPITLVNFAGINNTSPAALSGNSLENFTAITANVDTGGSYPITLKGNTGGDYETYLRVYFDWNQNNVFTDPGEAYDIGIIENSTGTDAVQLTGIIAVPPTALAGSTRMRVIKAYNAYADSCNTDARLFGQAEDYSVTVVIPTCVAPSAGIATVTSSTTATLSWTSTANDGAIVIQPAGTGTPATVAGTGIDTNGATTYAATLLTPMTAYEFYVRNECTPGVFSSWSGPYAFNTTQLPGCASNPTPANGATGVPVGPITLTWDVPTTGDAPTSYDIFTGATAATVTTLLGNYPTNTTGNALVLNTYNATVYWKVVPKNIAGSATGCAVWSFTTQTPPGYCLSAPNGQYPGGTVGYTPTTCDGIFVNEITTGGYAGEYSLVNVVAGQTYQFRSSIATDFITISNAAGNTSFTAGVTPLTWVSTITGQVRFFTHVSNQCGAASVNRTRSIICGVVTPDAPDYANLQWPETLTFTQGGSGAVFGQVYEAGLTDVAPNIAGQAPGIQAWIGISPQGANTNPATWTNWVVATHNAAYVGNNDEYTATIGAGLTPGTYYYATRFRLNNGAFVYGGFDGGFWNGTTEVSGVLTVQAPPAPANDNCNGAIALTVNSDFNCGTVTPGSTLGATLSMAATPCYGNPDDDVWFSFVATNATHNVSLLNVVPVSGTGTDMYFQVLSGACGAGTSMTCSDADSALVSGLTVGNTYYVRVYSYYDTSRQNFNICVGTPPPPPANDECAGAILLVMDAPTCDGSTNNGTNAGATDSGLDLADCFEYGENDVWFMFTTGPNVDTVDISTDFTGGTNTDTEIALYSGACGTLVEIACDQDSGTTILSNGSSYNSFIDGADVDVNQTYYVRVSGYSDTAFGSFCLKVSTASLANSDFTRASLSVYPNPVKDILNLSYAQNITAVGIFNLLGQEVMVRSLNAPTGQIDMSGLASGTYIVKVTADDVTTSIKVIKE